MFDWMPLRGWLLIAIAAAAYLPARYVLKYAAHAPSRRDITQPPEDLSWRTRRLFAQNLAFLVALIALAIFIFTPQAEQFARSPSFWPILGAGFGAWAIFTAARGFRTGTITPLVRGMSQTFDRNAQPKRFWASMAWNALFGSLMLWLSFQINKDTAAEPVRARCYDGSDIYAPREELVACDVLIARARKSGGSDLAALMTSRGAAYHRLGDYKKALADYQAAIRLNPSDDVPHYNRGLIYQDLGDVWNADTEYAAAIRLNPKAADARRRSIEVREILDRQQASVQQATLDQPE